MSFGENTFVPFPYIDEGDTNLIIGTGHPSLSLPCGFVPAADNAEVKLPTGIMLTGRKYDDVTVLKAAAAWEKAFDWKKL